MTTACPYCGQTPVCVDSSEVYPYRPDLRGLRYWLCRGCGAYVGCHRGSDRPLGRLANAELRRAKMDAHHAFDRLWRTGVKSRGDAYAWLAERLGMDRKDCHIGMFDVEQCNRVVAVCREVQP